MEVQRARDEITRLRTNPCKFQCTYLTPLKDLKNFVSDIISALPADEGTVTIDSVVFEPKYLVDLLAEHNINPETCRDISIKASGQSEIVALLEAVMGDWLDFLFLPSAKSFALYVDHDEYTTFFADAQSELANLRKTFAERQYKLVRDYQRFF